MEDTPARRRWRDLPPDAPREAFFEALRDATAEHYLAEPSNPYRQSGRSSGAARWEETRRPLADAVPHGGDYLDVGCANGLLLETLVGWCAARGVVIRPHGVDFVPALVDLARTRLPGREADLHVGNAFDWEPPRRYDFVRTSLEIVPPGDREAFVRRQLGWVEPGGRLFVCHYRDEGAPAIDVEATLGGWGLEVAGARHEPVELAWVDVPAEPDTIPLVRYQDVLWALPVRVGDEEALFLLDTAAGVTVLDRELAARADIRARGRWSGRRMTGEVVELGLAEDVLLELGGRPIRHETVGVLDLGALLPAGWPRVGGAVGLPTFDGRPFALDLMRHRLRLDASPGDGREVSVRTRRDGPSVDLFLEVRAPSRSLWLEVDTGNTGPVLLSPEAAEALGLDSTPRETVLDVAGLGPVPTPVVVKDIRYDGNVGAPFLALGALTVDVAAGRAWIRDEEREGRTG